MTEAFNLTQEVMTVHHYITKYWDNGKHYAESWIQINMFGRSYCFSKRRVMISTEERKLGNDKMENMVVGNNMTIMGPSGLATISGGEVLCVDHFRIENH